MINLFSIAPDASQISSDPLILTGAILMGLGIVVPCLIWFIRNACRAFAKKDYWVLNKVLKYSWIIGIAVFLIGLVLLISKLATGA